MSQNYIIINIYIFFSALQVFCQLVSTAFLFSFSFQVILFNCFIFIFKSIFCQRNFMFAIK